jgi:hypothetical protein
MKYTSEITAINTKLIYFFRTLKLPSTGPGKLIFLNFYQHTPLILLLQLLLFSVPGWLWVMAEGRTLQGLIECKCAKPTILQLPVKQLFNGYEQKK